MFGLINCIYCINGTYCKNKRVKRSLFGFGARYCIELFSINKTNKCKYKRRYPKPRKSLVGQNGNSNE